MDKHFIETLDRVFSPLSLPLRVMDAKGLVLYPENEAHPVMWPEELIPKASNVSVTDGFVCVRTSSFPPMYVSLPNLPGAMTNALLAASMVDVLLSVDGNQLTRDEVLRRMLVEGLDGTALETMAMEQGIDQKIERCVILFQTQNSAQPILKALRELFEGSTNDYVVEIGRNSAVLLRDMRSVQFQELPEFVAAVADTVREEAGLTFLAGIGEPQSELGLLARSLRQAREALEIGRAYHNDQDVFSYRFLLLERFMQEIPVATAKKYYETLFNRRNSRVFSDEMIKTIDTFFNCHLNVSEAARRLYIHRNTLVYRLDKVQRATGLDLRTFEDAITFRMLRMLGKRELMD